ncbi:SDR family oxidoreductase [Neorhizobium galegae]|uniref:SDR family oxidoreductase n=1 Tax=Neorhizobium galegae TaxID=399 RepID=UPI00062185C1|nr:SDR family oxidoreductase [Neorhizobium galegae]CDZ26041.1 Oxidoreductase, short chain dehydrogenase/reductase family [Neorhizobium galegae bv. officinalis]KAA9388320.1 SDR family oxidoreductase [Neorhizobium galegae]KAB1109844.1 SDR family oxidoreductase [Neorhizobium galegae]MCM2501308.1 SDR family oxidoreductase [Neorhizobium galegae]MCQ1770022.1 SDR family oxidoreductase [Neorhizobium galegae]
MTTNGQRVAIVTGASKGIGRAIALRLAEDGIAVVVNYATSRQAADEVVAEIEAGGGKAVAVQADVGSPTGVATLFDAAEQSYGGVDILVNNAGVIRLAPLAEMDDETFENQIAINLTGTFRGIREAGKRLRDGGRIINFSSSVVGAYGPAYGGYAATKAAVEAMTHVASKELGRRKITVNAVAPGPVETELFMTGKSEELVQNIVRAIPLGRLGQPQDIATVVSFLAGPDGGWVNGQVLRANGGMI